MPLGEGHRFPVTKYRLLRDELMQHAGFVFEPAPLASLEDIKAVHDPAYADAFCAGTLSEPAMRRMDRFPLVPRLGNPHACQRRRHARRHAGGAHNRPGLHSCRRHASRIRSRRLGVLRLQRYRHRYSRIAGGNEGRRDLIRTSIKAMAQPISSRVSPRFHCLDPRAQ